MAEWHAKQLDMESADYNPYKGVENPTDEQKTAAVSAKTLARKTAQARTHLKDGQALIASGHDHLTKGYKLLQDVSRNYFANDVNLPNPAGKSEDPMPKGEQEQKSSDSDNDHSLLSPEELSTFLSALRGE